MMANSYAPDGDHAAVRGRWDVLARLRAAPRRDRSRGWWWGFGLGGAVADQPHNRAWARRKTAASGQLEAMAMRTRRTLPVTRAPIFRSFKRMLPQAPPGPGHLPGRLRAALGGELVDRHRPPEQEALHLVARFGAQQGEPAGRFQRS